MGLMLLMDFTFFTVCFTVVLFDSSRFDRGNPLSLLPPRRTTSSSSRRHGRGTAWSSDIEALNNPLNETLDDPLREPELCFSTDHRNSYAATRTKPAVVRSAPSVSSNSSVRSSQAHAPSHTTSQRLQRTHDDIFQL